MPIFQKRMLVLAAALLGAPALAKTPLPVSQSPADGMKAVASAQGWGDITKAFQVMPTNVQKDWEAAIQGLAFPDVRYLHAGLVIRQADGRVIKVVFGKHGKSFIDGKPWRMNALASPADEIARIAGLTVERTAMDWLEPRAEAAGASAAAALAYAGTSSWKAGSCAEDSEYSDEQKHDCGLMGVAFYVPSPVKMGNSVQTGLKCPQSVDNGTLTFTFKSTEDGSSGHGKIVYENGLAVSVGVDTFDPHGKPYKHHSVDFKTAQDQNAIDNGHMIVGYMDSIHTDVCGGTPEVKKAFFAKLAANRKSFQAAPESSSSSDADTFMQ